MGLIGSILGLGRSADKIGGAVERVAEVFVPNRTKSDGNYYRRGRASLDQLAAEFKLAPTNAFDGFVSGLNRLPRPTLALGTVGLFAYAMADPVGFSIRMQGLDTVPDQLWWLLGAIVTFYFGARELHYKRNGKNIRLIDVKPSGFVPMLQSSENAAVDAWRQTNS
ncbi:MAG: holin family protein [Amylibacter sp.]|nr:holin family protein [Amylibacter sp.]